MNQEILEISEEGLVGFNVFNAKQILFIIIRVDPVVTVWRFILSFSHRKGGYVSNSAEELKELYKHH